MVIHKFEPKKKYIEDLEDTSESDTTSISDNWDDDITYEDEESVDEEDMVQRSIVNRTDIDEDFLLRIEDTGIRIIIQRINNSTLEECPVYHTLEPRRTSLEVSSNPQFIDSVSTSTNMANLFVKVHNLLHNLLKSKKYVTFILEHILKGELQKIVRPSK